MSNCPLPRWKEETSRSSTQLTAGKSLKTFFFARKDSRVSEPSSIALRQLTIFTRKLWSSMVNFLLQTGVYQRVATQRFLSFFLKPEQKSQSVFGRFFSTQSRHPGTKKFGWFQLTSIFRGFTICHWGTIFCTPNIAANSFHVAFLCFFTCYVI